MVAVEVVEVDVEVARAVVVRELEAVEAAVFLVAVAVVMVAAVAAVAAVVMVVVREGRARAVVVRASEAVAVAEVEAAVGTVAGPLGYIHEVVMRPPRAPTGCQARQRRSSQ